jgi:hypothetical protein
MRFHAEPSHANYHPAVNYMTITLNGVKVRALEVDDVAGIVREYVGFDESAGEAIYRTRRGVVRIVVPHEHSEFAGWPKLPAQYIGRPVLKAAIGIMRVR